MLKFLHDCKKSFENGLQILKNHAEVFLVATALVGISLQLRAVPQDWPEYVLYSIQFAVFIVNLTFTLSIPHFLSNTEADMEKRIGMMVRHIIKALPQLFFFAIVVYISTRYISRSEYIDSYNQAHSEVWQMFINSLSRFVLIVTSVYFSVRVIGLGQSIIDSIVFTVGHIPFALIMTVLLTPVMFIGPLYLNSPYAAIQAAAEQIGVIFITAWVLAYMRMRDPKLKEAVKKIVPVPEPYASNVRRIGAGVIDFVCFSIFSAIFPVMYGGVFLFTKFSFSQTELPDLFWNIYYPAMLFVYCAVSWILFKGKSIGKLATGLQIARADGKPLQKSNLLIRAFVLFIEVSFIIVLGSFTDQSNWVFIPAFFVAGALLFGSISFLVTQKRQSLHDIAAGTVVLATEKIRWWIVILFVIPSALLLAFYLWAIFMV